MRRAAVQCWGLYLFLVLIGCPTAPVEETGRETGTQHTGETETDLPPPTERDVVVAVWLDGVPSPDTLVVQAGTHRRCTTDLTGQAMCTVDFTVPGGDIYLIASHPDARVMAVKVPEQGDEVLEIQLTRYLPDNPEYTFLDPGTPDRRDTTAQCAHCHVTINEAWHDSPHRTSATNPIVQDTYAGVAQNYTTQERCIAAGGQWWEGLEPGSRTPVFRCYLGDGALPALNDHCGDDRACDAVATEFGGCADCHAPAIDGELGGQNLLDATGLSYDYGVHCDFCHKVSDIDLTAPPGNAGRLVIHRPGEVDETGVFGGWEPLSFGPFHDVPNPVMGAVQRDHFTSATFCAGCHEQATPGLQSDDPIDSARWPEGTLPVQTTYSEWQAGPMNEVQPCQACHMPPDPSAGNSADLYQSFDLRPGYVAGWERPTGTVKKHSWIGPRQPESGMLEMAAALHIETQRAGDIVTATVTTKNIGAGHAIPTGEPMRSMVLLVRATCGDTEQPAVGGDVVPAFAGYFERRTSDEPWTHWPAAEVGQQLVVIAQSGSFRDYDGPGSFALGQFTAAQKGLPEESYVGMATIVSVTDGFITTEPPLPSGDVVYRVPATTWPEDGDAIGRYAGRPGMAFARVLADGEGHQMVPFFRASDVVIDNRLMPQYSWTSAHAFAVTCDTPVVDARLWYRPYVPEENDVKQWGGTQHLMVGVSQ